MFFNFIFFSSINFFSKYSMFLNLDVIENFSIMNIYSQIYFFIPEIFFIIFILLALVLGIQSKKKEKNINIIINLNILNIFFLFLLYLNFNINYINCFEGFFQMNNLIWFLKLFICFSYFLILFLFIFIKKFFNIFEYIILLNISVLGMLFFISSNDFISFYLTLELQTLPLFLISAISLDKYITGHAEVGIKYYIMGALSSIFLLFGIVLMYSHTGLTNFNDLKVFFYFYNLDNYIFLSFIFILIGLFFKIGLAPFHNWLPDVYSGVSVITMGCFALLPKISIFGGFLNIFYNFLNFWFLKGFSSWFYVFIIFSLLSLVIGSLGALKQNNLKKLFAYSAISHGGYLILILFLTFENYFTIEIFIFYLIVYILLNFSLFFLINNLKKINNLKQLKNISDLKGLSEQNLGLALHLSLTLFSLAGIPPLAGFFSKILLLQYLVEYNLFFVVFIIISTSLISAYYYLRIIVLMFFYKQTNKNFLIEFNFFNSMIVGLITFFNLSIYFFFDLYIEFIKFYILCI